MRNVLVSMAAALTVSMAANCSLPAEVISIDITVAPNVINIASSATVVTIHTDIPYSAVAGATVTLNGIEISWWKSDNQGNFVAKFEAGEVKGIVTPGTTATLTLSGETRLGDAFSGSDDVEVIAVKKKG